jgi:hypothetical protein
MELERFKEQEGEEKKKIKHVQTALILRVIGRIIYCRHVGTSVDFFLYFVPLKPDIIIVSEMVGHIYWRHLHNMV